MEIKNFRGSYEACVDAIEGCKPFMDASPPIMGPYNAKPKGS